MNCPEHLLALSAAGLIEADEERLVREHARECPSCAARLASLAELAMELRSLPAPVPPAYLVARVARQMAEDADRRQGSRLAAGTAVLAWLMLAAEWQLLQQWSGPAGMLWVVWSTLATLAAAPVLAGLFRRERSAS